MPVTYFNLKTIITAMENSNVAEKVNEKICPLQADIDVVNAWIVHQDHRMGLNLLRLQIRRCSSICKNLSLFHFVDK